jgi:Domain of unknown function (DUF4349)
MRWSDKSDNNLEALLRGEGGGRLGSALAELREDKTEPPEELRERVRAIAAEAEGRDWTPERKPPLYRRYRFRIAHVAAAGAAVLVVTVAMNGILALSDATDDGSGGSLTAGPQESSDVQSQRAEDEAAESGGGNASGESLRRAMPRLAQPPPAAAPGAGGAVVAPPPARETIAPVPSKTRAQDYSARIKLHVDGHDELSAAVQSAIRSTRQLGGYVTYVDYGTSGSNDGGAELAVRVPIGRVQTAVAQFSQLGTILEQKTEIVDLQGRIDRITRDIQSRRDRIAKLEAELRDPTLSSAERDRLEARLVQAKRGLANATRNRASVVRQSRYAKLDLAFTTEKREEPAAPPSELRKTLDDAVGILLAELAIGIFLLIVAAPILFVLWLAWRGLRLTRRLAGDRLLEAS